MPATRGGNGWNSAATLAQATRGSVTTIATVPSGTLSAMAGCTITAPASVSVSAATFLRLLRQNATSSDVAAANGATPCNIIRRGGASPPAASTTAASANGPARRKKRGSPGWNGVSVSGPMASPLARQDEASAASVSDDGSDTADPPTFHGQCFCAALSAAGFAVCRFRIRRLVRRGRRHRQR